MNLKDRLTLALLVGLGLSGCMPPHWQEDPRKQLPMETPELKQHGFNYVSYSADGFLNHVSDESLEQLRNLGVNAIALVTPWYQNTLYATEIYPLPSVTATDASLAHAIRKAHELGMMVMLKPHLSLQTGEWRGNIRFNGRKGGQRWFNNYEAMIMKYAQLAERNGVEMFCIGTELDGTTRYETEWRGLVHTVRQLYHGKVTYAANHDATEISWWDAVDYIGINAYHPLEWDAQPLKLEEGIPLEDLVVRWQPYHRQIETLSLRFDRKVLFTEAGYRSVARALQRPWDYRMGGEPSPEQQAFGYEALFESFLEETWFAGVYLWNWESLGGTHDDGKGYMPRDKPAEEVVHRRYRDL